jgi:MFS family permease
MKTKLLAYPKIKSIHLISAIALLWGLSDALISFYIPIQMQEFLHNLTLVGLLFSISSVAGALSDPLLGFLSSKQKYTSLLLGGLFFR